MGHGIKQLLKSAVTAALLTLMTSQSPAYVHNEYWENYKLNLSLRNTLQNTMTSEQDETDVNRKLLSEKDITKTPIAFRIFCIRNAAHCSEGETEEISFSDEQHELIKNINYKVNKSIKPRRDNGDKWQAYVKAGDCEDYVLTKRAELVRAGLPISALRVATATTGSGEGHAVLIVRTSNADYVLDNRSNQIKTVDRTDLNWIAISGANPLEWRAI